VLEHSSPQPNNPLVPHTWDVAPLDLINPTNPAHPAMMPELLHFENSISNAGAIGELEINGVGEPVSTSLEGISSDPVQLLKDFFGSSDWLSQISVEYAQQSQMYFAASRIVAGDFTFMPAMKVVPSSAIAEQATHFDALTGALYLSDTFLAKNISRPVEVAIAILDELTRSEQMPAVFGGASDAQFNSTLDVALSYAQYKLTSLFAQADWLAIIEPALGNALDADKAQAIAQSVMSGELTLQSIVQVVPAEVLRGANGVFDHATQSILLSETLVQRAEGKPETIGNVLLEEFGHYLDAKLNLADSPGDEGEYFAAIVEGRAIGAEKLSAIKAEDDSAYITINTRTHFVEQSSSEPLVIGNTINDVITDIEEPNQYTFSLSNSANFYIDALDSDGTYWSLTNSIGDDIDGGDLSPSGTQPLLWLDPGVYTLAISAYWDATTAYSFRVLNLADAAPIEAGVTLSDYFPGTGEAKLYQFQGVIDDRIDLDIEDGYAGTQWRLIDPYGNDIPYWNSPRLPETGIYTLIGEGYGSSGGGSYSVSLTTITDPPPEALSLNTVVNGRIENAGLRDQYTFSLSEASTLLFDVIGGDYQENTYFRIIDADGNYVFDVTEWYPFGNEAGHSLRFDGTVSQPLYVLPEGDYTLVFEMNSDLTGNYSFQLLNFADARAILPGEPLIDGYSAWEQAKLYKFQAAFGEKFEVSYLDANDNLQQIDYLMDADGRSISTQEHLLGQTYFVMVEPYQTGELTISLNRTADPTVPTLIPLEINSITTGSIIAPGDLNGHTFHLDTDSKLYLDSLTSQENLNWSLIGPTGTIINDKELRSSDGLYNTDPILNLGSGDYTLFVYGVADTTGSYNFRLLDLSSALLISPGTLVQGSLAPADETDIYQFDVIAGQQFYFDLQVTSWWPSWRLLDPSGSTIFNNYLYDVDTQTLTQTGRYTLLLEGHPYSNSNISFSLAQSSRFSQSLEGHPAPDSSFSYSFNVQPVNNPVPQPLALGDLVDGSLALGGQNSYTFVLSSNSKFYFDSLTDNYLFSWYLKDEFGNTVRYNNFSYSDGRRISNPVFNLEAGSYTLTVDGDREATGNYQFRLSDLSSVHALTPGIPINGTLSPINETDIYRFNGVAGEQYFFAMNSRTSGSNATWRLIDPSGEVIVNSEYWSVDTLTLSETGSYTLLFEGSLSDWRALSYSFNVHPVNNPAPQPLTLGNKINGTLAIGGQNSYILDLSSDHRLYFDPLINNDYINWTLMDKSGVIIESKRFIKPNWEERFGYLINLSAGSYTLVIDGYQGTTGNYQFQLLDLDAATVIAPGTSVNGTH
jgi:hypothetical protein